MKGENKMSQSEVLELINQYNSTDRKVIKSNLQRIMTKYRFKPKDIMTLGFACKQVYGWTTLSNPTMPLFPQALKISVAFNFNVNEFLQ
jgi:hypothetical protein